MRNVKLRYKAVCDKLSRAAADLKIAHTEYVKVQRRVAQSKKKKTLETLAIVKSDALARVQDTEMEKRALEDERIKYRRVFSSLGGLFSMPPKQWIYHREHCALSSKETHDLCNDLILHLILRVETNAQARSQVRGYGTHARLVWELMRGGVETAVDIFCIRMLTHMTWAAKSLVAADSDELVAELRKQKHRFSMRNLRRLEYILLDALERDQGAKIAEFLAEDFRLVNRWTFSLLGYKKALEILTRDGHVFQRSHVEALWRRGKVKEIEYAAETYEDFQLASLRHSMGKSYRSILIRLKSSKFKASLLNDSVSVFVTDESRQLSAMTPKQVAALDGNERERLEKLEKERKIWVAAFCEAFDAKHLRLSAVLKRRPGMLWLFEDRATKKQVLSVVKTLMKRGGAKDVIRNLRFLQDKGLDVYEGLLLAKPNSVVLAAVVRAFDRRHHKNIMDTALKANNVSLARALFTIGYKPLKSHEKKAAKGSTKIKNLFSKRNKDIVFT